MKKEPNIPHEPNNPYEPNIPHESGGFNSNAAVMMPKKFNDRAAAEEILEQLGFSSPYVAPDWVALTEVLEGLIPKYQESDDSAAAEAIITAIGEADPTIVMMALGTIDELDEEDLKWLGLGDQSTCMGDCLIKYIVTFSNYGRAFKYLVKAIKARQRERAA